MGRMLILDLPLILLFLGALFGLAGVWRAIACALFWFMAWILTGIFFFAMAIQDSGYGLFGLGSVGIACLGIIVGIAFSFATTRRKPFQESPAYRAAVGASEFYNSFTPDQKARFWERVRAGTNVSAKHLARWLRSKGREQHADIIEDVRAIFEK